MLASPTKPPAWRNAPRGNLPLGRTLWMKDPAGSCLVLDGAEQFSATLPANVFSDSATKAWKLQMMVYIDDFAGWGFGGNPVVFGVQNDQASIGWQQETWDRAMAPKFFDAIPSAKFASDFPRQQWAQVAIEYDGKGTARFVVNGQVWGTKQACARPASVCIKANRAYRRSHSKACS